MDQARIETHHQGVILAKSLIGDNSYRKPRYMNAEIVSSPRETASWQATRNLRPQSLAGGCRMPVFIAFAKSTRVVCIAGTSRIRKH
jgi:hypothetical protein